MTYKYRILEEGPGRFVAQIKYFWFWCDLTETQCFRDGCEDYTCSFGTQRAAEEAAIKHINDFCAARVHKKYLKQNFPRVRSSGEVNCP